MIFSWEESSVRTTLHDSVHSFIHPNPATIRIRLSMIEQHCAGFIIFVTGKAISLAGNKWYYRAQRWVIGPNDLEINLNSHWVGYINTYCRTECRVLLGGKWGGRGGNVGRRGHCCQRPPRSWCYSHFLLLPKLNDSRLKELLRHRQWAKKVAIHSLLTLDFGSCATPMILHCSWL